MKHTGTGKKEVELDTNGLKPLTDEELECAAGGGVEGGTYYERWVCNQCGGHSDWGPKSRYRNYPQQWDFHCQGKGCYEYNFSMERIILGPNETLPD